MTFKCIEQHNTSIIQLIWYLIILNFVYIYFDPMKGENNSNRILPIRSLLQNLKQEGKKQYLQLDNKNISPNIIQNNVTPRIKEQNGFIVSHRNFQPNDSFTSQGSKEHKKGISLNKHTEKNSHQQKNSRESLPGDSAYTFLTSKKDKTNFQMSNKYPAFTQQPFKVESALDFYYNKSNKQEKILTQQIKQDLKDSNKRSERASKFSDEMERESLTLTDKLNSKCQEETRYMSKFEKLDSQPIFKDELTKTKTELFHKEALLFQKTQELEEKQKVILFLQKKLQIDSGNDMSKIMIVRQKQLTEASQHWRKKYGQQQKRLIELVSLLKIMEEKVSVQAKEIEALKLQLNRDKQDYKQYESDNATNYTLINLKLRQYEAEQKQKHFRIIQMKEKEKKTYEHQQKIIKALSQLLRQKEQIIFQVTATSISNVEQLDRIHKIMKEQEESFSNQIEHKQLFIRQLSAEVGDLKENLKNMELRIREMIEEEEEYKKSIEDKQMSLQTVNQRKYELQAEIKHLNSIIANKHLLPGKQQTSINDLKGKISELNEIIFKRESSLIAYKEKSNELEERLKKITAANRSSPQKTNPAKLINDNQRLNEIVKDIKTSLSISLKLNQSLNEEVAKRELIILNYSLSSKYGKETE